jgi:hypothetical protein
MPGANTLTPLDKARGNRAKSGSAQLFTIKQVGDACGLPHPVIARRVPRTWTGVGWLYTAEQLLAAIAIAEDLRWGRTLWA